MKFKKSLLGFSLLEVIISLACIGIIFGISIPVYQSFQVRNDLDIATNNLAHSLRRAQKLSVSGDGDTKWGVYVQTGSIIIFKGTSYQARDISFDESFDVPATITPSGMLEVVFSKVFGIPESVGTFTFTSSINETRNITINQKGMVDY